MNDHFPAEKRKGKSVPRKPPRTHGPGASLEPACPQAGKSKEMTP